MSINPPRFSSSNLPAAQTLTVHAPPLGSEPGALNDFLERFMIGLLPWDLDWDEKWAQGYLETVHIQEGFKYFTNKKWSVNTV